MLAVIVVLAINKRLVKTHKAESKPITPESRLDPVVVGSLLFPVGLLWYGWAAERGTSSVVPILGTVFIGVGMTTSSISSSLYLVDMFGIHAASATAASLVLRCVFGAIVPLAGPALYERLGLGWGNSLLALIGLVFAPIPLVFRKYPQKFGKALQSGG